MGTSAIFLDRDGVLNENRPDHVRSWADFSFLPRAVQALRLLTQLGVPIFVVTNQAAISRRLATKAVVEQIHRLMIAQLRQAGAEIAGVFYCPHDPSEGCQCRKPAPGLLLDAAARFDIDLARSVLVGDACTDILAGQRAGCKSVLVLTGRGHLALQTLAEGTATFPTAITSDLMGAVPVITALLQRSPLPTQILPPPGQSAYLPQFGVDGSK